MRTLVAGLGAFQRRPMALLPISLEAALVAAAIALGVLQPRASVVASVAAFPMDVYFDLKHGLAVASSWPVLVLSLLAALVLRSSVIYATFTVSENVAFSFVRWRDSFYLCARTQLVFLPVAVLFFTGTAIRYAPFIWIAAPVGLAISVGALRRALRLDVGAGAPDTVDPLGAAAYFSYAVFIAAMGASVSFLGDRSALLAATLILMLGPLNALVLVGWRECARNEIHPGGGKWIVAVATLLFGAIAAGTFYDRVVRSPAPVATTPGRGTLMLLGGADSTWKTGSLTELDVRSLGYPESRSALLSYAGKSAYSAADTHVDLDTVARSVAGQIDQTDPPRVLVGHSQAALVLDRILDEGLTAPDRAVLLAPPPPYPPLLTLPPPNVNDSGRTGADLARGFSWVLRLAGRPGFDLDGPVSPTNLDAVAVRGAGVPRMSVWALADSVWLDRDWRRPGEINLVAVTDHVGVTNNGPALRAGRAFIVGGSFESDVTSWTGSLVPVVRYMFEPWRPENV